MKRRGMQPDDAYRFRTVGDVQVSPDGARVAYVVGSADRESDELRTEIWVAPVDGGSPARRFASGPGAATPRWSPDGRWLAYTARRDGPPALMLAPLDGGEPVKVTDADGPVSQPAWSPDGGRIAYVARIGITKRDKSVPAAARNAPRVLTGLSNRMDGIGWYDGRAHVFVLDVASGVSVQLTSGDFDHATPSWSPDGTAIVCTSDRSRQRVDRVIGTRADVYVVAADGGGGKPRKLTGSNGNAIFPRVSPDGSLVAFVGHEHGDDFYAKTVNLFTVPFDGSAVPRRIANGLDRSVGTTAPAQPFDWTPGGSSILFLAITEGRVSVFEVSLANDRVKTLVAGDRQIDSLSQSADGRTLGFSAASLDAWPGAFVRRRSGDEREVSGANADLAAEVDLAPVERRMHVAPDGLEIESFLLRPPASSSKRKLPLVLEIHGGPHGMHPMGLNAVLYQSIVASGFALLLPNPRGSGGYGEAFTQACVGDWGGADFDDLMGAVDSVIADGIADPKRLSCGGYSYGGFMTTWTIGHTKRFNAACVGAPVVDQVSMIGTTDIPRFSMAELGGLPWERPDVYDKRSPLTYVRDIHTPTLIHHSEGDLRCPIGQGEELYQSLKMLGREVVFVRYPGGFHVARTPSQAVDRAERMIAWYTDHDPR
jgi:dipeptidyl aminopeptidase/acylaminoacyl peptidase